MKSSLENLPQSKRPSKITIPPHAHPHARLVFALMSEYRVTYDTLEVDSGLLRSTIKAWRSSNTPSLQSIEAALGVFGWSLVPCPPLGDLPADVLAQAEEFGQRFKSDHEMLASIMATVCKVPLRRIGDPIETPAPRAVQRSNYWLDPEPTAETSEQELPA